MSIPDPNTGTGSLQLGAPLIGCFACPPSAEATNDLAND